MLRLRLPTHVEPEQLTRWTGILIVLLAGGAAFSGMQYRQAVLRDRARSLQVAETVARDLASDFRARVETWAWLGLLEAFVPAFQASPDRLQETADAMRSRGDAWLQSCERNPLTISRGAAAGGPCLAIRPESYVVFDVEGTRLASSNDLAEGPLPLVVTSSLRERARAAPDDMRRFHVIPMMVDTSTFLVHMRVVRTNGGHRVATAGFVRAASLSPQLLGPLWSRTLAATFPEDQARERIASVRIEIDGVGTLHAPTTHYTGITARTRIWGVQEAPVTAEVALNPGALASVIPGGLPRPPDPALAIGGALLLVVLVSALFALHQARQLMRTRTLFLTGVSHELRTPLTQILMYAETLERRDLDDVRHARATQVIVRESRRLIHMIENILAFARGGTGKLPLNPRRLVLAEVVDDTLADLGPLLARHGAHLDMALDSRPEVHADPGAVRQVLVNLIDNALRFGPAQQRIRVSVEEEDAHACLAVTDEGPGIPAALRARAWQPFTRLTADRAGTGLGLALVRRLAMAMGGNAQFGESAHGLRVEVRLPLALPATLPDRVGLAS